MQDDFALQDCLILITIESSVFKFYFKTQSAISH